MPIFSDSRTVRLTQRLSVGRHYPAILLLARLPDEMGWQIQGERVVMVVEPGMRLRNLENRYRLACPMEAGRG
jgi:hypothetical protein